MFDIYISFAHDNWDGYEMESDDSVILLAFMVAVKEIRRVLKTTEIELLAVGEMEFVIWCQGRCKGFLSVQERGPKT